MIKIHPCFYHGKAHVFYPEQTKRKFLMKKIFPALLLASAVFFSGCGTDDNSLAAFILGQMSNASEGLTTATQEKTWNYTPNSSFKADSSTLTVNMKNLPVGKALYLVKVNPGKTIIPYSKIRYVAGMNGISSNYYTAWDKAGRSVLPASSSDVLEDVSEFNEIGRCYIPKIPELPESSGRAVSRDYYSSIQTPVDYKPGDIKKLWIPADATEKTRKTEDFKLKRVDGEINVWIPAGVKLSSDERSFAENDDKIDTYVNRLKDILKLNRTLFGNESNTMRLSLNNMGQETDLPMSTSSSTGTQFNVVFFDMASRCPDKDGESFKNINGYFSKLDYLYGYTSSNAGKYIYINTARANEYVDELSLTLAHEFMHMIQFNTKCISQNRHLWTTPFGEMMGELAKDLVTDYFKISDVSNPKIRFQAFNIKYWAAGLRGYSSDAVYYSTNFAFGAWLCRNFGGAKLARLMMQNSYDGDEAIVNAVNTLNNTNYTIEQLIELFLPAVTHSNAAYSLNKKVTDGGITCTGLSSGVDYNYPQDAINVFNISNTYTAQAFEAASNNTKFLITHGPQLFSTKGVITPENFSPFKNFKPVYKGLMEDFGITIHKVGTIQSSSASVTFTDTGHHNLNMYLMAGPERNFIFEE